jgi:drug/metabolite transporter (DMT)-like permease
VTAAGPTATPGEARLPLLGIILLGGIGFGWGVNWPFIKIALAEVPVWQYRACTLAAAGLLLFAIAAVTGERMRVPRGQWGILIVAAVFNITGWHALSAFGVLHMASGKASLVAFTMPVWAAILSRFVLGEPLTWRKLLALVFGVGAIAVLLAHSFEAIGSEPLGIAFMLGAAFSWTIGTVIQKKVAWQISPVPLAGWQLLIGVIPVAVLALTTEPIVVQNISAKAFGAMAFTVVVALVFCYYAWFNVIRLLPASIAAIGTLSAPAIGLVSGAVMLGEPLGLREIAALVLVLSALTLVLYQPRRAAAQ